MRSSRPASPPCPTTAAWTTTPAAAIRKDSCARTASSWSRRSRSAWASTSPTCASSRTWICRARSKATTRKPAAPGATASPPRRGWRGACRTSSRSAASSTRARPKTRTSVSATPSSTPWSASPKPPAAAASHCLSYFGEASQPCGNCDVCINPPTLWDGTEAAQKLLSTVYRTGQRFGAGHVIDVLLGKTTEKVDKFGHSQLSVFGIGASQTDKVWRAVLRQLVVRGLLEVDHTAYGALKLTEAAQPVLKGEETVMLRAIEVRPARSKKSRFAPSSGRRRPPRRRPAVPLPARLAPRNRQRKGRARLRHPARRHPARNRRAPSRHPGGTGRDIGAGDEKAGSRTARTCWRWWRRDDLPHAVHLTSIRSP